ncbi:MAG: polysaccharide deacetylase family protein [Candidatus Fermentibacteria bacterium]|nr:polysaccharide deacetylase family protein [Candidatus Fermentibacteria bacterium]
MKKHIFTVDVENWYDGFFDSGKFEARFQNRLEANVRHLLSLLQEKNANATFFWLGSVAVKHRILIREIQNLGHDIGCHGWSHTHIDFLGRETFLAETNRAIGTLSEIIGEPIRYYRAPFFSISSRTPWALPILAQNGIKFDSSIVPVKYWRYGFTGFEPGTSVLQTDHGEVTELPVSTGKFLGWRIPFGGGAWFRLIPYRFIEQGFCNLEDIGAPGVFYIHPWELDPGHPKIYQDIRTVVPHYWNLGTCEKRLTRLLENHEFTSIGRALNGL